ncbi:MAG: hypothetical protein F4Y60_10545 [Boseongicola sp. SB0664_bin_43]|uniref:Uncharacterized protein n=1 Tax=Boseongicola sp. SB0664_bin_43 TaxID=2604844 RepID=A0A6B0Y1A1_9RHOB|nr:hypothetical protein [Boseongicola sp. SB0664_bin_43]
MEASDYRKRNGGGNILAEDMRKVFAEAVEGDVEPFTDQMMFAIALKGDPDQAETPPSRRTGEAKPPFQGPTLAFSPHGKPCPSVRFLVVPEEGTPRRTDGMSPMPDTSGCH